MRHGLIRNWGTWREIGISRGGGLSSRTNGKVKALMSKLPSSFLLPDMLLYPLRFQRVSLGSLLPTLPCLTVTFQTKPTPHLCPCSGTHWETQVALAHSPLSPQQLTLSGWLVQEGNLAIFTGDYIILFFSKLQHSSPPFLSANGFTCDVTEKPSGRGLHVPTTVSSKDLHVCPDRLSSFLLVLLKCLNFDTEPPPPTPLSHTACSRALHSKFSPGGSSTSLLSLGEFKKFWKIRYSAFFIVSCKRSKMECLGHHVADILMVNPQSSFHLR